MGVNPLTCFTSSGKRISNPPAAALSTGPRSGPGLRPVAGTGFATNDLEMCARTPGMKTAPRRLLPLLLLSLLPALPAGAVETLPGGWLLASAEEISADADLGRAGHSGCGPGEFVDVYGYRWALVASESSELPAYPLCLEWVREAALAAQTLLEGQLRVGGSVRCALYVLPRPREALPVSSSDGLGVYLSPGRRPLSRAEVHAIVFHEIGHLLQRQLLPSCNREGWARYRKVRGIADVARFSPWACHASRPAEIFAEDFRLLYGTDLARSCTSLEQSGAPSMIDRPELRSFFRGLLVSRR